MVSTHPEPDLGTTSLAELRALQLGEITDSLEGEGQRVDYIFTRGFGRRRGGRITAASSHFRTKPEMKKPSQHLHGRVTAAGAWC